MYAAFLKAFQDGCRRVVLVGTDIQGLMFALFVGKVLEHFAGI